MQEKVKIFNENKMSHNKPLPVHARLLDIESEIGELAKEYLKHSKYGTGDFELDEEFILEYGDVLYSLLSLGNEVGINAEEALNKVFDKYQARLNKNSNMGSGR